MIKIYGVNQVRRFRRPVVALGVFDGVHRGHINILKCAVAKAHSVKGKSIVITFWPHPQGVKSLYSLDHRLRLFERLGVDACVVLNFTKGFAHISAPDFIRDILAGKIRARYIYVGKNFRFGKGAQGDLKLLAESGKVYGYKLKAFSVIKVRNKPISSTYIRRLIRKGDLAHAAKLLTRPVSILGSVMPGNYLGRRIGFPTANINPHHEVIPPSGIYAVRVIFEGKKHNGICYIGRRPTLKRTKFETRNPKLKIEVHILDFNRNIYNKYLEINFIKKIREDKKFSSLQNLSRQIEKDVSVARKIL
jgi:riboflavin kinase/FMN adenylyltransferase